MLGSEFEQLIGGRVVSSDESDRENLMEVDN